MKLSRQEARKFLKDFREFDNTPDLPSLLPDAIDTAIQCMGETKLIIKTEVWTDDVTYVFYVTECCKIGLITTEKYCPECGKKIIR